jgi:oxygen-independent coproporphyrinogen-3 oxidase
MPYSRNDTGKLPGPDTAERPAGIYVHIPFCRSKCPYCSFVSFAGVAAKEIKSYMAALDNQARQLAVHPWVRNRSFHSLYIGGGTPSTVDVSTLAAFIAGCLDRFPFPERREEIEEKIEVTLEANPNTVTLEMLKSLRTAGVNRLSLGVQSFSDAMLRGIGRLHSAMEGARAVTNARETGYANINVDLMYGLPGQDFSSWQKTLEMAAALEPEHLSVYELTVEPNTPFAELEKKGKLGLPEEDMILAMFEHAHEFLTARGYEHYEISNYARRGFQCVHNINYWENGSYIGLGSGAFSCFSGVRIQNVADPALFINAIDKGRQPFQEAEMLPLAGRFRETVIMGLRMSAGVSVFRLQERFGITPEKYYGETLMSLIRDGLLEEVQGWLRLTGRGMLLANRVMACLV